MADDRGDLHASVAETMRGAGQRYTKNRRDVIQILEEAERPLTIPEILDGGDGLAQSSVYRNLAVLEETGVVHRVQSTDEWARYELAEDLTGHHHHLICSSCGSVDDFTVPPEMEESLHQVFDKVADRTGFTPEHHRLDLVGVCARCD
jgi:Fe2+ or Zn2+ uptake regulation protein